MATTDGSERKEISDAPRVLVVDDEESIRSMLRMVLESEGFAVTAVATVPEALVQITQYRFDALISDLNVGHPADGFVVVSAMRRTRPEALTFILTGYPGFETALEALRQHVNGYLIKGTRIEELVEKIKAGLAAGHASERPVPTKRMATVVEENKEKVIGEWLRRVNANDELRMVELSEEERKDHVPGLLEEAIARARDQDIGAGRRKAAEQHGTLRYHQGYSVPMLITEARLLQDVIAECVQRNFLVIDLSNLMPDMIKTSDTIAGELEQSVRAFAAQQGWRSRRHGSNSGVKEGD
jgi:DNA-binding response OmpR family regulator